MNNQILSDCLKLCAQMPLSSDDLEADQAAARHLKSCPDCRQRNLVARQLIPSPPSLPTSVSFANIRHRLEAQPTDLGPAGDPGDTIHAGALETKETLVDPASRFSKRMERTSQSDKWIRFKQAHAVVIGGYFRRHGLHEADAEELTQEVFDRLLRDICRDEFSRPDSYRAWLLKAICATQADYLAAGKGAGGLLGSFWKSFGDRFHRTFFSRKSPKVDDDREGHRWEGDEQFEVEKSLWQEECKKELPVLLARVRRIDE